MESDLTFIEAGKFSDIFESLILVKKIRPSDDESWNAKAKFEVVNYLDKTLCRPQFERDQLPGAIVFDLQQVSIYICYYLNVLMICIGESVRLDRIEGVKRSI